MFQYYILVLSFNALLKQSEKNLEESKKVDGKEAAWVPWISSSPQQKKLVYIHIHAVAEYNIYSSDVLKIRTFPSLIWFHPYFLLPWPHCSAQARPSDPDVRCKNMDQLTQSVQLRSFDHQLSRSTPALRVPSMNQSMLTVMSSLVIHAAGQGSPPAGGS